MLNLFVMIVKYKAPIEQIDSALQSHREYLKEHYKTGVLLASGTQNPRTGGVIIGKFLDKKAAVLFSENDPFVKQNLVEYHIIEFSPILHNEILSDFLGSS